MQFPKMQYIFMISSRLCAKSPKPAFLQNLA
jgi:hypothetical protein